MKNGKKETLLSNIIKVGDLIRYKYRPKYNKNFVFKVLDIRKDELPPEILTNYGYIRLSWLDGDYELVKESETEKDIEEWLK